MKRYILALLFVVVSVCMVHAETLYSVSGQVVGELSRQGIPYVAVTVDGSPQLGASTNAEGRFTIYGVKGGMVRLIGQALGYDVSYSEELQVSAKMTEVELRLVQATREIDSIIVRPSLFRKMIESPVSLRRIGAQQIEKSPGANRDVSKIVQSYPGVSFSPAGYRNDLIVRGGSPAENRFYVDGIEIPNINHFSTQGASGGPVSILNADLIREIEFFTGAFPVQRSGALSSIIDVKLRSGDSEAQRFKATLGASEVSLSGSGHFSDRTTYIFSARQSYLQLLFKTIGLPFLPNFIDAQFKIRHKFSPKNELTFLALGAFDTMTLNEEGTSESSEYILSYLPKIEQQTLTTGVRFRHFEGDRSYSLVSSHSYVNNLNLKYDDNDESRPENLNLRLQSTEQKTTLRNENRNTLSDQFTLRYGAQVDFTQYSVDSYTRYTTSENLYETYLGLLSWGFHAGVGYKSPNERFSASAGGRFDANTFSGETNRFWEQFSPRISASYALRNGLSLSSAIGRYYAMPPLTALSYELAGVAVNDALSYTGVTHYTLGVEWRPRREILASVEGFYKDYSSMPISVEDDIPLADLGTDYGSVGNEALIQSGHGRAYGLEFMSQIQVTGELSLVASLTLFRSEYATSSSADYRPSSWDNRVIFNASGTYFFKNGWSVGAKVSAIGGAPYTPYDLNFVEWDVAGVPQYDYSLHNTERYNGYAQLDLRVDKIFYFPKWMFGLYLDLQNALVSEFVQQDIPLVNDSGTGLKYLSNVSGTMLPTFGITAQF